MRLRILPATPIPIPQAPTTIITAGVGSGATTAAGLEAWAAPATRHTHNSKHFMSASLPDAAEAAIKPQAQNCAGSTKAWYVTLGFLLCTAFTTPTFAATPALVELKLPTPFDPFASTATAQYDSAAQAACAAPKPPGFGGYTWRLPKVAAELRKLAGDSPGKQIYIAFLKSKYGYQIGKLNQDYGTDAQSFTELLDAPMRAGPQQHDAEFDAPLRREMLDAILSALRKCDSKYAAAGLTMLAGW